ncbi:hypothetical protein TFKS16_1117 [Tannerella forsythia KS16]|uniref:Uncharacterized protein n=1 Tax=Tannerella forsythia (strain ATCC 43037 / JCM 10827 / CCUG 21028 A / KCTC 5666 / FDC 338) TaxID=203275 RepID=G8UQP0_TANFA|nr:hypothetical protein BFO_1039 [Tannerella forsythia 92A2]BAR48524.1 hypothetical protein TF3313_0972 [Tannerella forsythia 3313]BAR51388.1 hypothetical protein TFKS16_1117 [Tannerella forsythia KS16]
MGLSQSEAVSKAKTASLKKEASRFEAASLYLQENNHHHFPYHVINICDYWLPPR